MIDNCQEWFVVVNQGLVVLDSDDGNGQPFMDLPGNAMEKKTYIPIVGFLAPKNLSLQWKCSTYRSQDHFGIGLRILKVPSTWIMASEDWSK